MFGSHLNVAIQNWKCAPNNYVVSTQILANMPLVGATTLFYLRQAVKCAAS